MRQTYIGTLEAYFAKPQNEETKLEAIPKKRVTWEDFDATMAILFGLVFAIGGFVVSVWALMPGNSFLGLLLAVVVALPPAGFLGLVGVTIGLALRCVLLPILAVVGVAYGLGWLVVRFLC